MCFTIQCSDSAQLTSSTFEKLIAVGWQTYQRPSGMKTSLGVR